MEPAGPAGPVGPVGPSGPTVKGTTVLIVTSEDPSIETDPVASPARVIVLGAAHLVAVSALPVRSPIKLPVTVPSAKTENVTPELFPPYSNPLEPQASNQASLSVPQVAEVE